LRERDKDIEQLAMHFFAEFTRNKKTRARGFSASALSAMNAYHWPGNVRELINRVRRGIVMCDGPRITQEDLELNGNIHEHPAKTLAEARRESERSAIQEALMCCRNNVSEAARRLRVSRVTLYRLIDKHGLKRSLV
jgi:DNA-binding NtrC family response regulator